MPKMTIGRQFLPHIIAMFLLGCGGGGGDPETVQQFGDSTQFYAAPYFTELYGSRSESRAVGGTSTVQLLAGDGMNAPWPQSVTAQVVVINHGLNDARLGVDLETYRANLRRLVRESPSTVVLETPNPVAPNAITYDTWPATIQPYAQVMREVAAETGTALADTNACVLAMPGWESMMRDALHPTLDLTRRIVRECVAPVLARVGV